MRANTGLAGAALSLAASLAHADVFLTEGTNLSVDVAADGRFVTDLLGGIWVVPANGGEAAAVAGGDSPARRPRWSPDANGIAFEAHAPSGAEIWLYSVATETSRRLSEGRYVDQHPDWHPDAERIVFSSARDDTDFDIWELDVKTGLTWRLTRRRGNETEPAWSANGRDLLYVHEDDELWTLVLRRRGQPEEILVASDTPIAAPAWRPDGSLVTYLTRGADGWSVAMTILSNPRLDRPLIEDEDFFLAPVRWLDRQQMIYAANGKIRKRRFNSWTSSDVPFRARVGSTGDTGRVAAGTRAIEPVDPPSGRTVIRAGRLFDGLGGSYRRDVDVVIDGGLIGSIVPRREHDDAIVIDLGDVTVLPGFIDAYGRLPEPTPPHLGPLLLSLGLTTLVAEVDAADALTESWAGKELPGPRILSATDIEGPAEDGELPWLVTVRGDRTTGVAAREQVRDWQAKGVAVLAEGWQVALGSGASLLLGSGTRPSSPGGRSYQDVQLASGAGTITFVSGLADAMTPGIDDVWTPRAASMLAPPAPPIRRFTQTPNLAAAATTIVLGTRPNGLPPGVAVHGELHALVAAGLSPEQALKAAGVNAASALGLGLAVGRVATGASADLVIVDGDPLADIGNAMRIVGVVRNGRFFSVSGLIDRSTSAKNVE